MAFRRSTIRARGSVAGTRCSALPGSAKVWPSAAVMCVALSAATIAMTDGGSGPSTCLGHAHAEAQVARERVDPPVEVEHERAAPPARSARRARVKLVEQVGVGRQAGEVGLDHVARQPPIGDDLVEVVHEVVLGHRGQRRADRIR